MSSGQQGIRSREVYAAAHVVCDANGAIDWEATAACRERLWDAGLGVADAMDTAQRGQGLSAKDAMRLMEATAAQARARRAAAGTRRAPVTPAEYPTHPTNLEAGAARAGTDNAGTWATGAGGAWSASPTETDAGGPGTGGPRASGPGMGGGGLGAGTGGGGAQGAGVDGSGPAGAGRSGEGVSGGIATGAPADPAPLVVGVATDAIADGARPGLPEIVDAYLAQIHQVIAAGAIPVMMASRHLAAVATGPDDYRAVYDTVLSEAGGPVILHWLGEAFDPALAPYWTGDGLDGAEQVVLDVIGTHPDVVRGIKVSLLDDAAEVSLRAQLPPGVRCFTGDDFHYTHLIAGGSDALLGAFAFLAPIAATAFARLDAGDTDGFTALLAPTETLSRIVFEAPTPYYKVGVAWISYLSGHQDHFRMLGDLQHHRDADHLARVHSAADALGLFPDPDLAAARARTVLAR